MEAKIISLEGLPVAGAHSKTFLEVLQEYIEWHVVNESLAPDTVYRYKQLFIPNIREYFEFANITNILVTDIRARHVEGLYTWLVKKVGSGKQRYSSRHVELCKRAMAYAVRMEYAEFDPISSVKNRRDKPPEVIHITKQELDQLENTVFETPYLQRVADLYVFQCYTGLSYVDLYNFQTEEVEGVTWIFAKRSKTDRPFYVPLFPTAKRILAKYKTLPVISNQKYNKYLKQVAQIAGINKRLTTHTGRKTMASLMNEMGLSTKSISELLGNTVRVCETHYLAKNQNRILTELKRLDIKL